MRTKADLSHPQGHCGWRVGKGKTAGAWGTVADLQFPREPKLLLKEKSRKTQPLTDWLPAAEGLWNASVTVYAVIEDGDSPSHAGVKQATITLLFSRESPMSLPPHTHGHLAIPGLPADWNSRLKCAINEKREQGPP